MPHSHAATDVAVQDAGVTHDHLISAWTAKVASTLTAPARGLRQPIGMYLWTSIWWDSAFILQGRHQSVSQLRQQLDELVAARDQMEQLVRVIVEIGSDLDLDVTLHRIVDAAMELTGARYGALGIRASDGNLVSFVHAGIDDDTARRLGDLPVGEGLRVDDLSAHPQAGQLHAHDPPMRALLAIPITVRAADFGNLYLADDRPGRVFSDSQEGAVRALATAAAAAIDNARLFERERESAKWTKASREITTALLSGDPQTGPLQLIVNRALELADAEQAILLVPREPDLPADEVDTLVVAATAGRYASEVIGRQVPMDGSTTGGVARRGHTADHRFLPISDRGIHRRR